MKTTEQLLILLVVIGMVYLLIKEEPYSLPFPKPPPPKVTKKPTEPEDDPFKNRKLSPYIVQPKPGENGK